MMRAHQSLEKHLMLGIDCRSKREGEAPYGVNEEIKRISGLSVIDLKHLVQDRKKLRSLVNNSQEQETDQCLIKEKPTANQSFENVA